MVLNNIPYAALDSRKPIPHEPWSSPIARPRVRTGQVSATRVVPVTHSAPMPTPNKARDTARTKKLGEKPATKLPSEYHRIDAINGLLRPMRSASQPEASAPTERSHE